MNAIEICCCAGGMALGFRRAGIEFKLAVDKNADACASYEHNLGHRPLQLDVHDLLRMVKAGWRPSGVLDLVVADPPCQPWSRAGRKEGLADKRDCLRPIIELVKILRPRVLLLSNVPGLGYENAAAALRDTVGSLSFDGYCVDEIVTDAANYGVPQRRIRPFWFIHAGGPCIAWPSPTHGPPKKQLEIGGAELIPWVTCRDALADLPIGEIGRVHKRKPHVKTSEGGYGDPWSETDQPAYTITALHGGGPSGGVIMKVPRGAKVLEWPWDRPSTTVTQEERIAAPGHKSTTRRTFDECVVLSERARARLQSFPDRLCGCNGGFPLAELQRLRDLVESVEPIESGGVLYRAEQLCEECWLPHRPWRFVGKTKGSRNSQLGMAMPPVLAEAIGRSIVQWFTTRSDQAEDLESDEQRADQ